MCGVCGIYNAGSHLPVTHPVIAQMMRLLAHRGPDAEGQYVQGSVGLGFTRLSILDLVGSNQPISNESGEIWLVFNGEIWNYQSLRTTLSACGHVFRTQGDAEVVVHAYEAYGTACFARLHGMFALAIWDARQNCLLLARDAVGKKPLYYTRTHGDLLFASEIKALFGDPRVLRQVNVQALADYCSIRYVPGPATLFQDIYKVQPGHWVAYNGETWQEVCYWDFAFEPLETRQPYPTSTYLRGIRQHIQRAVEERLIGDVPVGTLLSGGVDSSIVATHMRQLSERPVLTFAVGFDVPGYSELSYARHMAMHLGCQHHELTLTGADLVTYWPLLTWHRDEPVSEPSDLGVYLISCLAREHVKVLLSGEGGDELFGGYPKYALDRLARFFHLLPATWRKASVNAFCAHAPYHMRRLKLALSTLASPVPQRWINWFGPFHPDLKANILAPSLQQQVYMDASRLWQSWLDQHPQRDDLSRMLYLDTRIWLPDNLLMKLDKMTMAASLEGRTPLLDPHLLTYAASIPSHLKVHGWQTKYILKQAYAELLPPAILKRPKMGFNVPTGTWFRQELGMFLKQLLLSAQARSRGLFNYTFIEYLLHAHLQGRQNYQAQLFTLASLELWFQVFIDPAKPSRPDIATPINTLPCQTIAHS
jgi:asparagine synthase (glutamine-hydrolysing)